MKLLLIDESKAKNYILCVVTINADLAPAARTIVNRSRKKGQRQVHFVKESSSNKRKILQNFAQVDSRVTFFSISGQSENFSRSACIGALIDSLNPQDKYSLVFDCDESQVNYDKRNLSEAISRRNLEIAVEYRHEEPHKECLLWLPDALAWCFARGGNWNLSLENFNVEAINVL